MKNLQHPIPSSYLRAIAVVSGVLLMVACSSKPHVKVTALPELDTTEPVKFTDRIKLAGFSFGSFLDINEKGTGFQPMIRTRSDSAIVYMYRPDSSWNRSETVAASIFLNDKRLKSLLNNSYYAMEVPPGTYRLAVSRPLLNLYFQKGTVADITLQPGQDYFIKYAEQYNEPKPDNAEGLLFARPLIQVPNPVGLKQISTTINKTPNYRFVQNPNQVQAVKQKSLMLDKQNTVGKGYTSESEPLSPKRPVKLYNPGTW